MASSPEKKHEGWRFKLYQLDAEGQWDDKGTGYVTIKNDERLGGPSFHAVAEADGQLLLGCRIVNEDIYQKQGENIITWTEPANHGKEAHDLALSFQEEQGCREIWEKLSDVQGRYMSDYRAFEPSFDTGNFDGGMPDEGKNLPEPSIQNLKDILVMVLKVSAMSRDRYVRSLLDNDAEYLNKLMAIFGDCEEMEDTESLKLLAKLLKNIVLLNDLHLSEVLVKKEMFFKLAAAMEYDPDLKQRANYRTFLSNEARFHQVIPFEDPKMLEKIEQNFFLMLLRDYMLRPTMEETNLTSLSSMTFFNSTFILDRIFRESDYLQRVYNMLKTVDDKRKREEIWRFLKELVHLSKCTQPSNQAAFFKYLAEECPFFECFVPVLSDRAASLRERMCCVEILLTFLNHDAYHLRAHVIENTSHPPKPQGSTDPAQSSWDQYSQESSILFWLLRRLATDPDTGVLQHVAECLTLLLDTETMEGQDRDRFLGVFYDHYMVWLVEPLAHIHYDKSGKPALPPGEEVSEAAQSATRCHVCEIVTFCVRTHAYRMRYYIILNNLASKILKLTHAPEKYLRLAAIRFIRHIVGTKDDFYNRHLVKNNSFAPILTLFVENKVERTNLIHSAIIELFEFVRTENVKVVIEHLMDKFQDQVKELGESVPTFKGLIVKHEQNMEAVTGRGGGDKGGTGDSLVGKVRKRAVEDDDDAYFNEDDDDEDTENRVPMAVSASSPGNSSAPLNEPSSPPPIKLVDYDDDDDDDVDPFWSGKGRSAGNSTRGASLGKPPAASNGSGHTATLAISFASTGSKGAGGSVAAGQNGGLEDEELGPSLSKKAKIEDESGS